MGERNFGRVEQSEQNPDAASVFAAVRAGDKRMLFQLLVARQSDLNMRDQATGATPLIEAVKSGHAELVTALLAWGADVNAKDNDGKDALTYAIESGNKRLKQKLFYWGIAQDNA